MREWAQASALRVEKTTRTPRVHMARYSSENRFTHGLSKRLVTFCQTSMERSPCSSVGQRIDVLVERVSARFSRRLSLYE